MKKLIIPILLIAFIASSCTNTTKKEEQTASAAEQTVSEDLPDWQYVGYKIVHHMSLQLKHIDEFGFNVFDHPRIADYTSFVITPALDHFYSKAVADLRNGPVVVNTPACKLPQNSYASLAKFLLILMSCCNVVNSASFPYFNRNLSGVNPFNESCGLC